MTTNTGVVCYDADFYPYGGEVTPYTDTCTQNNYKFEGKERDPETSTLPGNANGNDDFGGRYYSSRYGRWLSAGWSSTPVAVPYANLSNPQTLNLYAAVSDDPESFTDLEGHCGPCIVVVVVGIAVGGFIYELHDLNKRGEERNAAAMDAWDNKISPFGTQQNSATERDATGIRDARVQDMGDMAITAITNTVPDSTPPTTIKDLAVDQLKGKVIDTVVDSAKNNTSQQNSSSTVQQKKDTPSLWQGFKSLFSPTPVPPPPPPPPLPLPTAPPSLVAPGGAGKP